MPHAPAVLLVFWAITLAYFDFRYRRIPNVLSLGAWVVAAGVLLIQHCSLLGHQPQSALMAACFAGAVTLPAYALKKLGAGDVKMLIAIGLLTSLQITITCFVVAAVLGGLMALFLLGADQWGELLPVSRSPVGQKLSLWLAMPLKKHKIAYGALFTAGLVTSLWLDHQS